MPRTAEEKKAAIKAHNARMKAKFAAENKCTNCGRPESETGSRRGFKTCQLCIKRVCGVEKRVRKERRDIGACPRCGGTLEPGFVHCESCRKRYAKHREAVTLAGLCRTCKFFPPRHGKTGCQVCADFHAAKLSIAYRKLRKEILDHYGHCCACCGQDMPESLEIDHINNDGWSQRSSGLAGEQFYKWLKENNWPTEYQTLCSTCNRAKHRNGGTCPHEKTKGLYTQPFLFLRA